MSLRKQLLLVSLLVLVLPWAGILYVNDVAAALRSGLALALQAQSKAIAERIQADENLLNALAQPQDAFYTPSLPFAPHIDGYDDWPVKHHTESSSYVDSRSDVAQTATQARNISLGTKTAKMKVAAFNGRLFAWLWVVDDKLSYHNPTRSQRASGDHILFALDGRRYLLRTSAPGRMQALIYDDGWQLTNDVKAVFLETDKGYRVELSLPVDIRSVLSMTIIDHSQWGDIHLGQLPPTEFVFESALLNQAVAVFTQDGQRISVLMHDGGVLAQHGSLTGAPPASDTHGFVVWLYKRLQQSKHFSSTTAPNYHGAMALQAEPSIWVRDGSQVIARQQLAIGDSSYLLLEQRSDELLALTNQAFSRLFSYTFFGMAIVVSLLICYASWLSFRIRRLSRAASSAMQDDGRLAVALPLSNAKDELGDLSRNFEQLLQQVQEYTSYLRTLSDKLSHELRTPIAVINGSLDNLSSSDAEDHPRYIQRAKDASHRLSSMLAAMGAAKRLEESLEYAMVETVPMHEMLTELHQAYQQAYPQASLTLSVHAVHCDIADELIVQLLDKLVDNAVSFCSEGGVVSLALASNETGVLLSVGNDGPLLPANMEHQIFDSLVSYRDTKEEGQTHFGLGLHIVKMIAQFHNAKVSAKNRDDGSGVVFSLLLPSLKA